MIPSTFAMRNRYFAVRHAESQANVDGIIVSLPANALVCPLTLAGIAHATAVGEQLLDALQVKREDVARILVFTSDYLRAKMTADLLAKPLALPVVVDQRLRERFFGDFELKANTHYDVVWQHDAVDANHTFDQVESVNSVIQRTSELVKALEAAHSDSVILLVAHGDVLQILQTVFAGVDGRLHRSLPHLHNCEVREMVLTAGSPFLA
eukprot:m.91456 g.91456  ORF g.91456 m.91456 type:complete len:209 (+) comp51145_c0_seq1:2-628(+)